ncbi:thermonuclease family protein [Paracoccus sp. (in: a-proteobacteria)]|uniref:thermonuclease family protein n=1 Tax=Paracoccus sp. TaxID=267 RepID=UPI002AFE531F|nr:thermonuclease family protein [Paracoccus sp. (in: a-proteobacteria)]
MRNTLLMTMMLLLCGPAQAEKPSITGRASVIDGDTIEIHGTRIRLAGIDAPESRQTCTSKATGQRFRCGQHASFYLADMIGTQPVTCQKLGTDKYRRTLARCDIKGRDIGAAMVRAGWALPYLRRGKPYSSDEAFARFNNNGLWGTYFQPPWEWRTSERGVQ